MFSRRDRDEDSPRRNESEPFGNAGFVYLQATRNEPPDLLAAPLGTGGPSLFDQPQAILRHLGKASPLVADLISSRTAGGNRLFERVLDEAQASGLSDQVLRVTRFNDGSLGSALLGPGGINSHAGFREVSGVAVRALAPQFAFALLAAAIDQHLEAQLQDRLASIDDRLREIIEGRLHDRYDTLLSAMEQCGAAENILLDRGQINRDLVQPADIDRDVRQLWQDQVRWLADWERRVEAAAQTPHFTSRGFAQAFSELCTDEGSRAHAEFQLFALVLIARYRVINLQASIASLDDDRGYQHYREQLRNQAKELHDASARFQSMLDQVVHLDFELDSSFLWLSSNIDPSALAGQRRARDLAEAMRAQLQLPTNALVGDLMIDLRQRGDGYEAAMVMGAEGAREAYAQASGASPTQVLPE